MNQYIPDPRLSIGQTVTTTGYAQAMPAEPPKLDALADRLNSNAIEIEQIYIRVRDLGIRLMGHVPTPVATASDAKAPTEQPNSMRRLSLVDERQRYHLSELNDALKRLEAL